MASKPTDGRTNAVSGESLAKVFVELRAKLAGAVSGIVPPKEIEDIVQETYVRVRQTENLDRIRSPRSFLFKTARNLALDHAKRAETRLVDSTLDIEAVHDAYFGDRGDTTFETVASDEEFAQFCDAVRYLPIQCRRAFVFRKVYGFSQKEIAEVMQISESTVEKHIAQGVKKLTLHMRKRSRDGRAASGASVTPIVPAAASKDRS